MLQSDKDALILEAAIEFGPDYFYDIRRGTLGETLYIEAPSKSWATPVRAAAPLEWRGLYVVVFYTYDEETEERKKINEKLEQPKNS